MTSGNQGRLLREGGSSAGACKTAREARRLKGRAHTDGSRQGAPQLSPPQSVSPGVNTIRQLRDKAGLEPRHHSVQQLSGPLLGCALDESARAAFESRRPGR